MIARSSVGALWVRHGDIATVDGEHGDNATVDGDIATVDFAGDNWAFGPQSGMDSMYVILILPIFVLNGAKETNDQVICTCAKVSKPISGKEDGRLAGVDGIFTKSVKSPVFLIQPGPRDVSDAGGHFS